MKLSRKERREDNKALQGGEKVIKATDGSQVSPPLLHHLPDCIRGETIVSPIHKYPLAHIRYVTHIAVLTSPTLCSREI